MSETQITNARLVDSSAILANDNVRYSLLPDQIENLAEDIAANGVISPLEVTRLPKGHESGKEYLLNHGHYRLAAIDHLNQNGGDMQVPVMIVDAENELDRRKRQISENYRRQTLSPIDTGLALKSLLDNHVPMEEVREIFRRAGGKKGNKVTPVSNSFVSLHLRILDLPKGVKDRIHDGRIPLIGAAKIVDAPKEDREKIVENLEIARQKAFDQESRDEERLIEADRKQKESEAKVKEQAAALDTAKEEERQARAAADAAGDKTSAAYAAFQKAKKEDKEAANEAYKAAQKEGEAAAKAAQAAKAAVQKIQNKLKPVKKEAVEAKKETKKAAKKVAETKKKAAGAASSRDVKKAVAAGTNGVVKLKRDEMYDAVKELTLPNGDYPKVNQIAAIFLQVFDSTLTPGQALSKLAVITGEKKGK